MRLPSTPPITSRLSPQVTLVQLRRLLRLGIILRWVAIAFAGLAGIVAPKPPATLFYLMLTAMIYNVFVMQAASRASDRGARNLALATTILDQFFNLVFFFIYANVMPAGGQVAWYFTGLIEAVAYFGLAGAVLSVAIFFTVTTVLDGAYWYAGHAFLSPSLLIGATLIVTLGAATLVPVFRILTDPAEASEQTPGVQLSRREQEVLRLVAEGYSNTMIAARLHLSDNTVKGYVENLLTHLNARNRAEAVAAASRLKLI